MIIIGIGLVQAAASRFLRALRFLLPAELAGLAVLLTGVALGVLGIPDVTGRVAGDPMLGTRVAVASATLLTMVGCSIWGARLRLFSAVIGIAGGYVASLLCGLVGTNAAQRLAETPWFRVPASA